MRLKASKGKGWYVYRFNDARADFLKGKEEDPFRARMDLLSSEEIEDIEKEIALQGQAQLDLVYEVRKRILEKRVLEVAGLEIELENGDIETPKNGLQLFEVLWADKGLSSAFEEIVAETLSVLKNASLYSRGELDSLRSRRDSSSVRIESARTGDAVDAAA